MCCSSRSNKSSSPPKPASATCALSRNTWRRATSSSSARKSRPPTSSPTASTGRTSSIATCCTPTSGSRIRNTVTRKPAGISNPKDFRNEIVNFVLRARANNNGKNPTWLSYEKLRVVIEKKMFSNTEDLLPVISFNAKASKEDQQKHNDFVTRMVERGYTDKQVRLLSEWYLRVRKSQ